MRDEALRAAGVALAGLLAAAVVLRLDLANPSVPFAYSSDALIQGAWAKTVLEHGWVHENPRLAAPFGQQYYDFPLFESANLLLQKVLGRIGGGWAFAVNAYWVLTFPLTAACAYAALAALGVSALPAAVAGVVYALLPYHLYRGEVHLFLSGYHVVPLCALVAMWIARGELGRARFVGAAAILLLTAGSGIYYGFFAAYFLVVAALWAVGRHGAWRTLAATGALLGILVFAGLANVAPSFAYWRQNGVTTVVERSPADSVRYSLRIASALMPIPDHRLPAFARLRESLARAVPPASRLGDGAQAFGLLASAGFVALLLAPVALRAHAAFRETLLALSCLTYAGVLLAATGGFGQLFAVLVTPDIRCWDRIVPFLGFFALAAVAIAMDRVRATLRTRAARAAFAAGAVGLGVLAIADQTSPMLTPAYAATAAEAASDRSFFRGIEQALPAGSMLFQLPYVPFPESPPRHRLVDYDLLRPYLATTTLRWSYGAVRTRFADAWIASVAGLSSAQMVDALALAGFRGIVVDGFGYEDGGARVDDELRPLAGGAAGRSPDGRYAWYGLDARTAALRSTMSDEQWTERRDRLLRPFYVEWQRGFYALEGAPGGGHRWSDAESALAIDNPRPESVRVRLTARACSGRPEPATLTVRGPGLDQSTDVTPACAPLDLAAVLPPGRTILRFASDAARTVAPGDDRALHFVLREFRLAVDGADVDVLQNP